MARRNQKLDEAAGLKKLAYDAADEWIKGMITSLEETKRDLEARRRQLSIARAGGFQSVGSNASGTNVVGWAVNDLRNLSMNLRTDLAANHGASLSLAEENLKTWKEKS